MLFDDALAIKGITRSYHLSAHKSPPRCHLILEMLQTDTDSKAIACF